MLYRRDDLRAVVDEHGLPCRPAARFHAALGEFLIDSSELASTARAMRAMSAGGLGGI